MKKKLMVMLAISIGVMGLSGCGPSKTELKEDNNRMLSMIADYEDQLSELNKILALYQGTDGPTTTIDYVGDGSGDMTFNTVNSKVVFPKSLEYTESTPASNTGGVYVTKDVTFKPSKNWNMRLDNASLELDHTNGISGVINVTKINKAMEGSILQEQVLSPWLDSFGVKAKSFGSLFVDKYCWGTYASAVGSADNEPLQIKAGLFGYGTVAVTFIFVYKGDPDSTNNEIIDTFIKSMTVLNQVVSFG